MICVATFLRHLLFAEPIVSRTLPSEPRRDDLALPSVLYALSEQVRLDIVRQLAGCERACGAVTISMPKSSLSHHFRVLRECGVVTTRREGKALINCLRREDLDARFPGLLAAVLGAR